MQETKQQTPYEKAPEKPLLRQPQKQPQTSPPHRPQPSPMPTWVYLLILFCTLVVTVLLIVLLVLLNPGSSAPPTDSDTHYSDSGNSESQGESSPIPHDPVRYPTVPSRKDYLVSGNGETLSGLSATSALLLSLDDYSVAASLNPDVRIYPASMTKIMTLIVACELVEDASVKLAVDAETVEFCRKEGAPVIVVDPGDAFTITGLLYGIGVESLADAALTVASYLCGSEEAFVEKMNAKASELGLTNTHFANCTGLDDSGNYSTAREIAIILAYALDNEFCKTILTTQSISIKLYYEKDGKEVSINRTLTNTMLSRLKNAGYSESLPCKLPCGVTVLGGKTGFTNISKYCLASFAKNEAGKTYILVTAAGATIASSAQDMNTVYGKFAG